MALHYLIVKGQIIFLYLNIFFIQVIKDLQLKHEKINIVFKIVIFTFRIIEQGRILYQINYFILNFYILQNQSQIKVSELERQICITNGQIWEMDSLIIIYSMVQFLSGFCQVELRLVYYVLIFRKRNNQLRDAIKKYHNI
ncbi:hypothetical protein pb186bvf_009727 [Paramecium bursaria]